MLNSKYTISVHICWRSSSIHWIVLRWAKRKEFCDHKRIKRFPLKVLFGVYWAPQLSVWTQTRTWTRTQINHIFINRWTSKIGTGHTLRIHNIMNILFVLIIFKLKCKLFQIWCEQLCSYFLHLSWSFNMENFHTKIEIYFIRQAFQLIHGDEKNDSHIG